MTYFNGKEKIHCQQPPPTPPKKKTKLTSLGPFQKKKILGLRCMLHLLIDSTRI